MDDTVTIWCFQIALPVYLFICDLTLWGGILMVFGGARSWYKQIIERSGEKIL